MMAGESTIRRPGRLTVVEPVAEAGRAAALFAGEPTSGDGPTSGRSKPVGQLGVMGELHPEVLEDYSLKHPVSVLELSLAKIVK